jgi:hypothetical protein
MARWKRQKQATFDDLPKRLKLRDGESRERAAERWKWLEEHGLSVVDYFAWLHARRGPHVPARRKLMSADQLRKLDEQREAEPLRW